MISNRARKIIIALGFATVFIVPSPQQASAMGSGNQYLDFQTGVTYTILKPDTKLPLLNFEARACRLHPTRDMYLLIGYGTPERSIALVETAAAYNCTGFDRPTELPSVTINGVRAKVGVYCSGKGCSAASFTRSGGEISFTRPASRFGKATYIRIGTQGGYTLAELTSFARSLRPVGK